MRTVQGGVMFFLSFVFVSCGSLLLPPLEISSVSVGSGIVDAASLKEITIAFSSVPTYASLDSAFSLSEDGSEMKGVLSISGKSATFVPRAGFSANKKYELTISTGVETGDGNSLAHEYSLKFTTKSESVEPSVVSVSPANGAELSVEPESIQIRFSEAISRASFSDAISISPSVEYVCSFASDSASVSLLPAEPLTLGQRYTITVDTSLTDISGNALKENFVSSFLYGTDATPPGCAVFADFSGASIQLTSALNSGIPSEVKFRFSFDEKVAIESVQNYIAIEPPLSMTVAPDAEGKRTATLTFRTKPVWNQRYALYLKKGVKDLAGNTIDTVTSYPFICDREHDRPPQVVKAYLDVNKSAASASSRYVALTAASSFSDLCFPAESYPADTTVTSTLYFVVRSSGEATAIPAISAMKAIGISETNSCLGVQMKKIQTSPVSGSLADEIRTLVDSDPALVSGEGKLFVIKVDLEIENTTNKGLINFSVSADLEDDQGNTMTGAWEAIYNKV